MDRSRVVDALARMLGSLGQCCRDCRRSRATIRSRCYQGVEVQRADATHLGLAVVAAVVFDFLHGQM